ncbi:formimidoylglutamate deiminase [Luteimonas granuli]|uniref:Formimidoylglutamate deiminase n=2 Tax=Luteimonas granuli TaxID=1176533 RepID=A0A518N7A2_9GAMM|nr:formimidoylglutamate deiminase [Luteimonas granuli]
MGGRTFWIEHALLPSGWAGDVCLRVEQGRIAQVETGVPPDAGTVRLGIVVPGLGNLHSHAFQRGMAGLAEAGGDQADSFWSWRELMYRFLDHLDPDSFQAIVELAYMEMLEAGFTRVGEFHYLHHGAGGRPYAERAEMCARVAAAAQATGIGLTLLPVFYAHSDFGGAPPTPAQARLTHDLEGFAALMEGAAAAISPLGDAVLGVAPHSLRATTPDELRALLHITPGPVHIHVAEQVAEVEACLRWSGQRPVQWLLEHVDVDGRWCLVHATHVLAEEIAGIAASGAVVGLCPITEANLGDGVFPVREFLRAGGRFGIGSDSNVLIDSAEELRLLEYGQRLRLRGRNVLAPPGGGSTGRFLFEQAVSGGSQALGAAHGLEVGGSADFVELRSGHPALQGGAGDAWLDSWLFAARNGAVESVWRRGGRLVEDGRHFRRDEIVQRYGPALRRVLDR